MTAHMHLTRRGFLATGAALSFVIGASGLASISRAATTATQADITGWVTITTEGEVHILFPSTEMGQGSSTALPLILAEEMDADWDRVTVEQLDTDDRSFGNPLFGNVLYTAGSTGVSGYFDTLRQAGAQVRAVLIREAAKAWDVPAAEVSTLAGTVRHDPTGRVLSYGGVAALPDLDVTVPERSQADLKRPEDYRLIGQDHPRIDIPAKSTGTETYAIDITVPGMVFAAVACTPFDGVGPERIDDAAARTVLGVRDVIVLPEGVAVIADHIEAAFRAKETLDVTWGTPDPWWTMDSDATLDAYAAALDDPGIDRATWRENGDAATSIAAADRTVTAEYRSDYAYHAQIEPMAAVASVDADGLGAEAWVGTQTQSWSTRTMTETLGTTPDRVRLNVMTMGGSFGRRTALDQEYLRDALLLSKTVGLPVKLVWTREDDVQNGAFRPAAVQRLRAGLTAEGTLQGWEHRVAAPSVISYFNPLRWSQVAPNDIISMRGSESPFYDLPDMHAEHVITPTHARLAPWRGIGASYTSFAAEAFMDELAAEAGRDPLDFRMDLLQHNPRGVALLRRVSEMSDWDGARPDTALGLSFAGYGSSMAAGVAEVALDRDRGIITVPRFWAAVDAGLVVAPDNARNQIEGGIVFGVSSSLKERITMTGGRVDQSNYYDYEILRAHEVPEITLDLAQGTTPPTGIGEAGTPMVAAAIANGFHALTGKRLRHLPFTPDRVLEALEN
ncbi:molybdopterin-dependent oxidoreductase [Roseobacter sp. YSTF-M11]|uniref:Molybdopterin-dependent oxidoreductase n=1 Tax=Roseobacter insulae TaxID=2859783 RepID=A0A9X1FRH0_9RHOB|nr:molybdopterin cofactor-binding domain-containing protein [Roseobacter insulae]MBW4706385.1 molybdopterin-dependent oxidoreductase [Roseobacter insulae]